MDGFGVPIAKKKKKRWLIDPAHRLPEPSPKSPMAVQAARGVSANQPRPAQADVG
jgi:hypothetical protein